MNNEKQRSQAEWSAETGVDFAHMANEELNRNNGQRSIYSDQLFDRVESLIGPGTPGAEVLAARAEQWVPQERAASVPTTPEPTVK